MIVGLYFNLFVAKKPLSWHKIGFFTLKLTNKTNFGIKLLSKLLKLQLNSKLKATIDLDGCYYILVALHQRFIKVFKGIIGIF